jgi:hypothetical protein
MREQLRICGSSVGSVGVGDLQLSLSSVVETSDIEFLDVTDSVIVTDGTFLNVERPFSLCSRSGTFDDLNANSESSLECLCWTLTKYCLLEVTNLLTGDINRAT